MSEYQEHNSRYKSEAFSIVFRELRVYTQQNEAAWNLATGRIRAGVEMPDLPRISTLFQSSAFGLPIQKHEGW